MCESEHEANMHFEVGKETKRFVALPSLLRLNQLNKTNVFLIVDVSLREDDLDVGPLILLFYAACRTSWFFGFEYPGWMVFEIKIIKEYSPLICCKFNLLYSFREFNGLFLENRGSRSGPVTSMLADASIYLH
jgi:hypothetical protein